MRNQFNVDQIDQRLLEPVGRMVGGSGQRHGISFTDILIRAVRRRAAAADILLTPPPPIVTDRRAAAAAADRMSASRQRRFRDVFTSCCTPAICC